MFQADRSSGTSEIVRTVSIAPKVVAPDHCNVLLSGPRTVEQQLGGDYSDVSRRTGGDVLRQLVAVTDRAVVHANERLVGRGTRHIALFEDEFSPASYTTFARMLVIAASSVVGRVRAAAWLHGGLLEPGWRGTPFSHRGPQRGTPPRPGG